MQGREWPWRKGHREKKRQRQRKGRWRKNKVFREERNLHEISQQENSLGANVDVRLKSIDSLPTPTKNRRKSSRTPSAATHEFSRVLVVRETQQEPKESTEESLWKCFGSYLQQTVESWNNIHPFQFPLEKCPKLLLPLRHGQWLALLQPHEQQLCRDVVEPRYRRLFFQLADQRSTGVANKEDGNINAFLPLVNGACEMTRCHHPAPGLINNGLWWKRKNNSSEVETVETNVCLYRQKKHRANICWFNPGKSDWILARPLYSQISLRWTSRIGQNGSF